MDLSADQKRRVGAKILERYREIPDLRPLLILAMQVVSDDLVPVLDAALASDISGEDKIEILAALNARGLIRSRHLPALRALQKHSTEAIAIAAQTIWHDLRLPSEDGLAILAAASTTKEKIAALAAIRAAPQIGQVDAILTLADDADREVREAAVKILLYLLTPRLKEPAP